MDTRYWGPSAWQLFHLISFRPHAAPVLTFMKDILPCKFCRASTTEFATRHPLHGNAAKWLYEIHNKVNHKLRTQCADDPVVPNPGEDPPFEQVKETYEGLLSRKPTAVPGRCLHLHAITPTTLQMCRRGPRHKLHSLQNSPESIRSKRQPFKRIWGHIQWICGRGLTTCVGCMGYSNQFQGSCMSVSRPSGDMRIMWRTTRVGVRKRRITARPVAMEPSHGITEKRNVLSTCVC